MESLCIVLYHNHVVLYKKCYSNRFKAHGRTTLHRPIAIAKLIQTLSEIAWQNSKDIEFTENGLIYREASQSMMVGTVHRNTGFLRDVFPIHFHCRLYYSFATL